MAKTVPWSREDLPDFEQAKVFVIPGAFYAAIVSMFAQCNCQRATTVEEADFVVFTGGEDVDPSLYGQKALPGTYFSKDRDIVEETFYHKAKKLGKLMYGICRGAQFLHVMNGGKLWQDVKNHGRPHLITDMEEDVVVTASSMHHQMLQVNDKIEILAVATEQVSNYFEDENLILTLGNNHNSEIEIEAGMYRETNCFFVQGHPEAGPKEYKSWCMWKLYDVWCDYTGFYTTDTTNPSSVTLDAKEVERLL